MQAVVILMRVACGICQELLAGCNMYGNGMF